MGVIKMDSPPRTAVSHKLEDGDGCLWLVTAYDNEDAACLYLGELGDPDLHLAVPGDLHDQFARIAADHADAVAFGAACRAEAAHTYDTSRGF